MCWCAAEMVAERAKVPVVVWDTKRAPEILTANNFLNTFFGCLASDSMMIAEAFAVSGELTCAFSSSKIGGEIQPVLPQLPRLLLGGQPCLPGLGSKESTSSQDKGADQLVLGKREEAIPGFVDLRLCAPNVEARLLVLAQPDIISAARLGSLCQGIRGIIANEIRNCTLSSKVSVQMPTPFLPSSSTACRCTMRSLSDVSFDVVMAGPAEVIEDDIILEYGIREALLADAHSIQLKLPPPGAPLPEVLVEKNLIFGAPMVQVLISTSTWVIQVMKLLTKVSYVNHYFMAVYRLFMRQCRLAWLI